MIFEWIYKILFYIDFVNLSVVSELTTINHGFWTAIHISMCAEIYFLYAVIDIYLICWLFLFGEVEEKKNSAVIDWYMWYGDCFYSKIESMDKNMRTCVTPQTQKGPKPEKNISKVPVDFSFLTMQFKIHYQSTNIKNYHKNFINDTLKVSQSSMQ